MRDLRVAVGVALLAALSLAALLAPWLPLRDPAAQPDGLVLRDLPPLSRVEAVVLSDGTLRFAHEVRPGEDGRVSIRRGERWTALEPAELAGPDPRDWRRRPLYLLGTDGFGRDLLSRLVHGGRVSLGVGFLAALMAVVVGGLLGLAAGFTGGGLDSVLMRFADLVLAVPRLFLVLLLVALWGASLTATVLVLGATSWMTAARLVRAEVLSLRGRDWVRAAAAAGASPARVALLHVLPAAAAPLLVESALRVGHTLLLETSVSFLGLGVPAPTPSWGNLIADGRDRLLDAWWVSTLPGLAIAATVVGLGLLAEALRDRLDPKAARGD
jgi:peptide/nickel transport system permease protein